MCEEDTSWLYKRKPDDKAPDESDISLLYRKIEYYFVISRFKSVKAEDPQLDPGRQWRRERKFQGFREIPEDPPIPDCLREPLEEYKRTGDYSAFLEAEYNAAYQQYLICLCLYHAGCCHGCFCIDLFGEKECQYIEVVPRHSSKRIAAKIERFIYRARLSHMACKFRFKLPELEKDKGAKSTCKLK